jgi:uncharacterized protein YggT (Ycf19 family)
MHDLLYRFLVLVWFLCYMAAIYLLLHIVVARLSRAPESRLLWFFSVITAPLTRPVRRLLPPDTPESRIRLVALGACLVLMIAARIGLGSVRGGDLD